MELLQNRNFAYMSLLQICVFFCQSEFQDGHPLLSFFNIEPYDILDVHNPYQTFVQVKLSIHSGFSIKQIHWQDFASSVFIG
jgi:hypothetical protein